MQPKILIADDHSMIRKGLKLHMQLTLGYTDIHELATCNDLMKELVNDAMTQGNMDQTKNQKTINHERMSHSEMNDGNMNHSEHSMKANSVKEEKRQSDPHSSHSMPMENKNSAQKNNLSNEETKPSNLQSMSHSKMDPNMIKGDMENPK